MWRDTLGVRVRLRNEEWKVFVQNRKQRVVTQAFRGGWIGDAADPRNFLAAFAEDGALELDGLRRSALPRRCSPAPTPRAATPRATRGCAWPKRDCCTRTPWFRCISTRRNTLVSPRVEGYATNPLDRHGTRWLRLRE
jgi:oligopeptide transport system substrate-binding protein